MGREGQCGPCSGRLSLTSGRQSRYVGITDYRSGDGHRPASRGDSRFTGREGPSVPRTGSRDRTSNFRSRTTGRQSHPKTKILVPGARIPVHMADPVSYTLHSLIPALFKLTVPRSDFENRTQKFELASYTFHLQQFHPVCGS